MVRCDRRAGWQRARTTCWAGTTTERDARIASANLTRRARVGAMHYTIDACRKLLALITVSLMLRRAPSTIRVRCRALLVALCLLPFAARAQAAAVFRPLVADPRESLARWRM